MKQLSFTLILLSAILFSTCQKDDPAPDPCANIVCLNNGFCANGECNCPPPYTGSNCSLEKTPSSITITRVTATKWPATDTNGAGWDFFDGPDITFTMDEGTQQIYASSIFYEDAVQGQRYTFTPNIKLNNPTLTHQINLFDYDDGLTANDWMGGITFTPYRNGENFPKDRVLDIGGLAFELEMTYTFN